MAVITFEDEYTKLRAVVRPASHKGELRRLYMQQEAASKVYDDEKEMVDAVYMYPRLICATPSGELSLNGEIIEWPPTLAQFRDMSKDGLNAWYLEVKRLNPDWFPDADELKKMMETSPQTGSSNL
jgi:hypothetical protein